MDIFTRILAINEHPALAIGLIVVLDVLSVIVVTNNIKVGISL